MARAGGLGSTAEEHARCPYVYFSMLHCLDLACLAKSKYESFSSHGLTGQDMQLDMESTPI